MQRSIRSWNAQFSVSHGSSSSKVPMSMTVARSWFRFREVGLTAGCGSTITTRLL